MKNKNLTKIFVAILALTFVFSGCKYEEGPTVSLRSKNNRMANSWKFKSVTSAGTDITSQYNRPNFIVSFDVVKAGNYTFTYRDLDGKVLSRVGGNTNSPYSQAAVEIGTNTPPFLKELGNNGSWTFVDNMGSIQMASELSQNPDTLSVPVFEILELRNNALKLKGKNSVNDEELIVEFESLNN